MDACSGDCAAAGGAAGGRRSAAASDAGGEDTFLLITVREARNLVAKDYETASSDP